MFFGISTLRDFFRSLFRRANKATAINAASAAEGRFFSSNHLAPELFPQAV
jgi:hypothetical protein